MAEFAFAPVKDAFVAEHEAALKTAVGTEGWSWNFQLIVKSEIVGVDCEGLFAVLAGAGFHANSLHAYNIPHNTLFQVVLTNSLFQKSVGKVGRHDRGSQYLCR